jgi:hypothetical protein
MASAVVITSTMKALRLLQFSARHDAASGALGALAGATIGGLLGHALGAFIGAAVGLGIGYHFSSAAAVGR